jgi:cyclophilin family peptidyl-prolyl cis-trans isomerase
MLRENIMKNFLFLLIIFLIVSSINIYSQKKVSNKMSEDTTIAVIKTNMGSIEVELFAKETPKTVENFVGLANKGYYKGVIFHRVIDGFMIQGGDPTGSGRGGASLWGGKFNDEIVPGLVFDKEGLLAMANAGPNTNGSQFFITLVPTPWLNGHHTIFGKVIAGMDVVKEIGKVPKNQMDRPLKDVIIESITIEEKPGK